MIGVVFGNFAPFNEEHKRFINKAIAECSVVIIGVCGYDDDDSKDYISFKDRVKLMKQNYQGNPSVIVAPIDYKKIGITKPTDLASWTLWGEELFNKAKVNPNCGATFIWYIKDKAYRDKLLKVFPKHHGFVTVDYSGPAEATIRNGSDKYINWIDKDFVDYLIKHKKIVISKEENKPVVKNLHINDFSGFIDDMLDNLSDAYQMKNWGISYEEFIRSAKQEVDKAFDNIDTNDYE